MSRWSRKRAASAGLNDAEARYLEDLVPYLWWVPKRPRRQIVAEFVEVLSSRPASGSLTDLVAALGRPEDVAARLRREAGFGRPTPLWRRWWLQSHAFHAVQAAAVIALVVGVISWRSYYGATPEFHNSCGGIAAPEYETLQAAGETEYRTTWRERQRYGLLLCPFTDTSGVTIERVFVDVPPGLSLQPVGWELNVERLSNTWVGDASANHPWRPEDVPWLGDVVVWFETAYCSFSGSLWFDTVDIEYRYRGRTRVANVPLGYLMSVDSAGACTEERRALDDEGRAAWKAAVEPSVPRSSFDGIGELGLSPESVSRDLCRYLTGVVPPSDHYSEFEPLEARAVFQLDDRDLAETLIDGAVLGICPEFADRREELVALLSRSN
ncbi:MAG: hypothetical protein R8F63_03295 [Acidimicrobiales bacterium]|nr:hypothetical protein [Acidimicrobiales bacterium]